MLNLEATSKGKGPKNSHQGILLLSTMEIDTYSGLLIVLKLVLLKEDLIILEIVILFLLLRIYYLKKQWVLNFVKYIVRT